MAVSIVYVLQLCLFLLLLNGSNTNDADKFITCDAGHYTSGTPAEIICNFNKDLNATKYGVNVVWYPKNASQGNQGTNILVCKWEGKTKCRVVRDGFRFNDSNLDPFTLTIPTVSHAFAGLYMCFLVPPGDTDPQACELIVRDFVNTSTETTKPDHKDCINTSTVTTKPDYKASENRLVPGIVVLAIIATAALTTLGIVLFLFYKRRHSHREAELSMLTGPLNEEEISLTNVSHNTGGTQDSEPPNEQVEILVSKFRLSTDDLKAFMGILNREREAAVEKKEGTTLKINPMCLPSMPNGNEAGDFLVVNLGSRTLKILLIKLKDGKFRIESRNHKVESDIRLGARIQLFQFIANSVKAFLNEHNLTEKKLPLAFVFSFPCEHYKDSDLTKARLIKWTKEFGCRDVVNQDVGQLLQEALEKNLEKQSKGLELRVVVDGCVGILVSVARQDPNCKIALGLGNGFVASYIQQKGETGLGRTHAHTVINMVEWGAVGEKGCLDTFRTEFDRELDALTVNRTEQILEKMVSKAYIGEIVRLVLVKLIESKLLFKGYPTEAEALQRKGVFTTDYVALIDSDKDEGLLTAKNVLKQLGIENYTEEDCSIIRYVCRVISDRSAHLVAAALAVLINHVNKPEITIATDGSFYRSHPRLQKVLLDKINELTDEGIEVQIKHTLNGSSKGAALIAAVCPPPEKTK